MSQKQNLEIETRNCPFTGLKYFEESNLPNLLISPPQLPETGGTKKFDDPAPRLFTANRFHESNCSIDAGDHRKLNRPGAGSSSLSIEIPLSNNKIHNRATKIMTSQDIDHANFATIDCQDMMAP
jgi:hypothetical protein